MRWRPLAGHLFAEGLAMTAELRLEHLPRPSQSVFSKLIVEGD